MSKAKGKKTLSSSETKQPKPIKENNTAKKKKKFRKKEKFKQTKPESKPKDKAKPKNIQTLPPVDTQQFSANWKSLQEVLKAAQTEKKQPIKTEHHNGTPPAKQSVKNLSKNSGGPRDKDAKKHICDSSASINSHMSEKSSSSVAAKRKKASEKEPSSAKEAKKKKLTVVETKPTEADIWFDDVDPDDIEATMGTEAAEIMRKKQGIKKVTDVESVLVKERAFDGLTKAVAIDCEMVGVGFNGEDSILARVSLVNQFGKCIYDKYVKPTEKVTDYRTPVSGIRPQDIKNGEDVRTVQREVAEILQGRIVVGHAIHNDLKILLLDHPKKKIRDTQKYKPFRKIAKSSRPALRVLCREVLNVKVQQGEHSSVQDAQATMRLYTLVKKQWEAEIKSRQKNKDLPKKTERIPQPAKNKRMNPPGL